MKHERIGIIGYGIVGQAVEYGFKNHPIIYYDKYKDSKSLQEVCEGSDIIFICLPTPYKGNKIDLAIIEDAVEQITNFTDNTDKIVTIKSTVIPGTTKNFAQKYPKTNFAFSPEFLTEANYLEDFANADRHVVGANDNKISLRLTALYKQNWPKTPVIQTDSTTAELGKYAANCFLATKVIFANEMDYLCKSLGVEWAETKKILVADNRIGKTHFDVTSVRGFGGKCLVPETTVWTNFGEKALSQLSVGDEVFDGKEFTKITALGTRNVSELKEIQCRGRKITGSEDHIHMIFDENDNLIERSLKEVKKTDWVFIPRPPSKNYVTNVQMGPKPNNYYKTWNEQITLDNDWGRLIGLYLAEGCTSVVSKKKKLEGVFWAFGEHEEQFANEILELLSKKGYRGRKYFQISNGTFGISKCWMVRCRQQNFVRLFKNLGLGKDAYSKNMPIFEPEISKIVIGAWLDGDGSYYDGTLTGFSRSKILIKSIDTALLSLGYCVCVGKDGQSIVISQRDDVEKICKWTKRFMFNKQRYVRESSYTSQTLRLLENGWKVKVDKIKTLPGGKVISMETKSGKYVANNILTHNCFPKDIIALLGVFDDLGVDASLLKTVWNKNLKIRKVRDWETIPFVKTDEEDKKKADK